MVNSFSDEAWGEGASVKGTVGVGMEDVLEPGVASQEVCLA